MSKYDAIIIGGGPSGLTVGALLANSGMKVLVLEKEDHMGGRAFNVTHKGSIVDHGIHGVVFALGYVEEVFSRLNKQLPKWSPHGGFKILREGKWQDAKYTYPRKEFRKIVNEHILPMSWEDIENCDDISITDWVSSVSDNEELHRYFRMLTWTLGVVGNRYDCCAAGVVLGFIKDIVTKSGGFGEIGYWRGGLNELTKPLAEALTEKGGELRCNAKVSNIVIEKGIVRGVEVETEERVIANQVLTTDFIEAPIVVNTLPIWELFSVVSPEEFPVWYVDWVKEIGEKVAYVFTIRHYLDKPLLTGEAENISLWWEKSPTGGLMDAGIVVCFPGYYQGGGIAAQFSHQWQWFEVPSNFRSGNKIVGHEARKLLHLLDRDIQAHFPDIEKRSLGKFYHAYYYGIAEAPWTVGKYRPSIQPPAVKNLYLSSDTLRETRYAGLSAVARCALTCVDRILKVNDK